MRAKNKKTCYREYRKNGMTIYNTLYKQLTMEPLERTAVTLSVMREIRLVFVRRPVRSHLVQTIRVHGFKII